MENKNEGVSLLQIKAVSCKISLSKNWTKKIWCIAKNMSLQYRNAMGKDFTLLWEMCMHSLWPYDHDSSKESVETIV